MKLSTQLKKYMDENDLTPSKLGVRLHIGFTTLNKILYDDDYSAAIATKIANQLGDEYNRFIKAKKCKVCGKEFIGKLGNNQFCSNQCRGKYYRNTHTPVIKTNAQYNNDIAKISKIAEEYNLSYGTFVTLEKAGWLHTVKPPTSTL